MNAWESQLGGLNRKPCPRCGFTEADEVNRIIREVAAEHFVPLKVMMGQSRTAPVAHARMCAIQRVAAEVGLGPSMLGYIFGRDHSTIIHSLKKVV